MKEVEINSKDTVVLERQAEINKYKKLAGRIRLRPGQKLWKMHVIDRKILEVLHFSKEYVVITDPNTVRKEMILEEGYLYTAAINLKTAKRKIISLMKTNVDKIGKHILETQNKQQK